MTRRAKVRAWRIETRDEDGRGWFAFVAAGDEDEARREGERCFADETVTGISGPFEKDPLVVATAVSTFKKTYTPMRLPTPQERATTVARAETAAEHPCEVCGSAFSEHGRYRRCPDETAETYFRAKS